MDIHDQLMWKYEDNQINFDARHIIMNQKGNGKQLIKEITSIIKNDSHDLNSLEERLIVPPRLLRLIMDNNQLIENESNDVELKLNTLSFISNIYNFNDDKANFYFEEINQNIPQKLKSAHYLQESDIISWDAYSKSNINSTVNNIINKSNSEIYLIILAHGGVSPGIIIGNKINKKLGHNIHKYALRFSAYKKNDTELNITDTELDYLIETTRQKDVFIFDEDIASGKTITKTYNFFTENLKSNNLFCATCYDALTYEEGFIFKPEDISNNRVIEFY